MTIKLDSQEIRCINIFEQMAGVEVKDCVVEGNTAYFVVEKGKLGLVIGKNGKNIQKIQDRMNKKVKVFEHADTVKGFVENMVSVDIDSVQMDETEDGMAVHVAVEGRKKPYVIGKNGRNKQVMERFLKREFDVDTLQVN